ncbi:MAG: hypothetical protein KC621_11575, partial [Myxococcales bacterium]|nr:hypothetical protein [Myxococcales bacterium]
EHLERNLRVFDPAYGDHLKRLAAWAFQHAQREMSVAALTQGLGASLVPVLVGARLGPARRDGHVTIGAGRLLRAMDATSSFGRFVRALRMGLGNREGDPKVAAALALFGPEFRGLDNEGLWKVTEALRDLFGDECRLANLVDLHETAGDDPGEGRIAGGGVTSDQVRRAADGDRGEEDAPRRPSTNPRRPGGEDRANVGADSDFKRIERVEVLPYDPAAHRELAADVAQPARHLRRVLEQLGLRTVPVKPRLSGNRLDRSRLTALATRGEPRVLVSRRVEVHSDLFVGLVVDCSGSMSGARMERARRFAALVAEACRGLGGVDLRIFGFTDRVIYDAGDAVRPAAHALRAGGGNNDAAGLHHAAQIALASRRRGRLLVMISDGAPTECTTTALRKLVHLLERRRGLAYAQVVVNRLNERCFDTYLEVLDDDVATAVRAFGAIVARLVSRTLSTSR